MAVGVRAARKADDRRGRQEGVSQTSRHVGGAHLLRHAHSRPAPGPREPIRHESGRHLVVSHHFDNARIVQWLQGGLEHKRHVEQMGDSVAFQGVGKEAA